MDGKGRINIPSLRPLLAWAWGCTVGPGLPRAAGGGCEGRAFVVDDVGGAGREGYFRAALPAALATFELEDPILCCSLIVDQV